MKNWKIYYGDRTTFDNEQGSFEDAPTLDIQCIVIKDDRVGKWVLSKMDFYWWRFDLDRWEGGDHFGLWDYLTMPGLKKVLFGRTLSNSDYDEIMKLAINDMDFPVKSAKHPLEKSI